MVQFVGADPVGLIGLADAVDRCSIRLRGIRGGSTAADTARGAVWEIAGLEIILTEQAEDLRWRARTIEEGQQVVSSSRLGRSIGQGLLAEFAALAVFDPGHRETAFSNWRTAPSIHLLHKMTPAEVSEAFSALSPSVARMMARKYPRTIGSLDGAPPELRYLSNALLIEEEIVSLQGAISLLQDRLGARSTPGGLEIDIVGLFSPSVVVGVGDDLAARVEEYQLWLDEERQILLFDTRDDGRVVEVFGDLSSASRVAVVVPGMSNDITNFSHHGGGFRANASNLYEARAGTEQVATIAWLGYHSPDNVGAAVKAAATDGAGDLASFIEGVDPAATKTVTVVAHSYGSVLAGLAARGGLAVDNLVFVGSPGTTLGHAGDAQLREGGRVWVGLADDDPIEWGISLKDLPKGPSILGPIHDLWRVINVFKDNDELWHGPNPADATFGATRIGTEGSSGHSGYFEAESLENLALIMAGRYSEVGLTD